MEIIKLLKSLKRIYLKLVSLKLSSEIKKKKVQKILKEIGELEIKVKELEDKKEKLKEELKKFIQ